jgi:hypothetical protein
MMLSTTGLARFDGIAKPMPTLVPVGEKIAVFTPEHPAVEREARAAGVAAVDRGVDLDEVVVGPTGCRARAPRRCRR